MAGRLKAWRGAELTKAEVVYRFSSAAQTGWLAFLDADEPATKQLRHEIEELRRHVEELHGFAIVEPPATLRGPAQRRACARLIGRLPRFALLVRWPGGGVLLEQRT